MVADWRDSAACVGMDPNLFINPQPGQRWSPDALAACARCAVADACLWEAMQTDEPYGLRGGLGPKDRERLRRPKVRYCLECETPFTAAPSSHRPALLCSESCRAERRRRQQNEWHRKAAS